MKRNLSLLIFSALAVFALLVVMPGCEGPQGDPGPQGPAGVDGTDGTDGVDANSFCVECHTLDNKTMVKTQFAMSSHAIGNYVGYAGGRNGCAKCHSYDGAMETMLTGQDTTATGFDLPVAFQCDMCHDFHMSLDEDEFPDYALRNNKPVKLHMDGSTIDLPGSGNLCAYCHQTRRATAAYGSGEDVNITSTHWGGHHGPQGNILAGNGAYEVMGSMEIGNTSHTTLTGCSDCHMAKNADNTGMGGHTWMMSMEDGTENVMACTECHSSATSFDVANIQTDVHNLLEELGAMLLEHELIDDGGHPVPSMRSEQEAGAVFNYILFEEDRSLGVHNPKYVKAILTNTVEMVKAW